MDPEQAEGLLWWGSALCFIALGILLFVEVEAASGDPVAFGSGLLVGALLVGLAWLRAASWQPS